MYAICPVVKSALTRAGKQKKKLHLKIPSLETRAKLLNVGDPLIRARGATLLASLDSVSGRFRSFY